jgi:cobyric acid synthase
LHGLFGNAPVRRAWLASLPSSGGAETTDTHTYLDVSLDRLADAVEDALDMNWLESILATD